MSEALDTVEQADREGVLVRALLLLVDELPAESIGRAITEAIQVSPSVRR